LLDLGLSQQWPLHFFFFWDITTGILMKAAISSSETLVDFQVSTRPYILEERTLVMPSLKNLLKACAKNGSKILLAPSVDFDKIWYLLRHRFS
jgi:hypothetical protein